jgi:hypothetical protein
MLKKNSKGENSKMGQLYLLIFFFFSRFGKGRLWEGLGKEQMAYSGICKGMDQV